MIKNKFVKEYKELIKDYTSNIEKSYDLILENYSNKYIFKNIPLVEYSLAIAKKLNVYDENIIISSVLYNPYKYNLDIKKKGFPKIIRKISKDIYFINFYELINNYSISPIKIKNMIVQSFFKIEAIIITFGEALVILDYFPKIKDPDFKNRFLEIIEIAIFPLAYQLGMQNFKEEFLTQLMKLKYKDSFNKNYTELKKRYPLEKLNSLKETVINLLKNSGHKPITYNYRYKSPGSLFQKIFIRKEKKCIDDVLDIYALRLIYNSKKECYAALKFIKDNLDVIENKDIKVRDFIKHPKENGYQSIHLNIILDGFPLEIQIRTIDMHNNAEFGVSAHFHYKNIEFSEKDNRLINILKDKTLIEKPKDISYVDYISVYTQTNQEIVIPKKSTLLDFAFSLHSDFAKYFDYAEINGKIIKDKSHLLKNGDKIKIIKSKKVTIKENDIDYLFNKRNKKKFNLILK